MHPQRHLKTLSNRPRIPQVDCFLHCRRRQQCRLSGAPQQGQRAAAPHISAVLKNQG